MFSTKGTKRALVLMLSTLLLLVAGVGSASAQTDDPYVADDGQDQGPVVDPDGSEVLGDSVTAADPSAAEGSTLPLTGGEVLTLALLGAGLVIVGGAVVVSSRRRSADV